MNVNVNPLAIDGQFFRSLIQADLPALDKLLARDFILIDVMNGSEIEKSSFLAALASGQVKFEAIEPFESRVRFYAATAVVTGRTEMRGRLGDAPFAVSSRYTHVYVALQGEWRLVAAQGTRFAETPDSPVS